MKALFLVLLLALGGCDMSSPQDLRDMIGRIVGDKVVATPELGNATVLEGGIAWYETQIVQPDGYSLRVWSAIPSGEGEIPVLIWLPTSMAWKIGGRLGPEDREQMLLFARAGVGVVGVDVPGGWEDNATLDELGQEVDRFMKSQGGVETGKATLDFVQTRLPRVDPARTWVSGEGPAGTLALLLAQADRRVRAVVAFDPVTDMAAYAASEEVRFLVHLRPDLKGNLSLRSPMAGLERLRCPLLLYHDTVIHGGNFESLDLFYMQCLRYQKEVTMIDTLDVNPDHAGLGLRTSRTLAWLKSLGGRI
jgi:hypothetical protein